MGPWTLSASTRHHRGRADLVTSGDLGVGGMEERALGALVTEW